MTVETLKGEEYTVEFSEADHTVSLSGTIRLQTTEEYEPIMEIFRKVLNSASAGEIMSLDFRQLRFLNSSGINAISRFVIAARKEDKAGLKILGNQDIYWQQKSLTNLQKFWPKVQIEIQ